MLQATITTVPGVTTSHAISSGLLSVVRNTWTVVWVHSHTTGIVLGQRETEGLAQGHVPVQHVGESGKANTRSTYLVFAHPLSATHVVTKCTLVGGCVYPQGGSILVPVLVVCVCFSLIMQAYRINSIHRSTYVRGNKITRNYYVLVSTQIRATPSYQGKVHIVRCKIHLQVSFTA